MTHPDKLLIVAQSGRMLAQLAVNAGYQAWVIDGYADLDTQRLAQHCVQVADLSLPEIRRALAALPVEKPLPKLLYGSGLEQQPASLAFLALQFQLLGNPLNTLQALQNKQDFFRRLAALAIPFPETVFTPPQTPGWLFKPLINEGGINIYHHQPAAAPPTIPGYWQRYLPGQVMSLTFIAGQAQLEIVGFNRQWSQAVADQAFCFSGIASQAALPPHLQQRIIACLSRLVTAYALTGLGSLDFINWQDECYVLEINARVPASAQLYDRQLLKRHVAACLGLLVTEPLADTLPTAYEILYAQTAVRIPMSMRWPSAAQDLPLPGAIIGKGQPICSIIAAESDPAQAAAQLSEQRQIIEQILYTGC